MFLVGFIRDPSVLVARRATYSVLRRPQAQDNRCIGRAAPNPGSRPRGAGRHVESKRRHPVRAPKTAAAVSGSRRGWRAVQVTDSTSPVATSRIATPAFSRTASTSSTVITAKPEFSGIVGALDSKEPKRLAPGTSQMDRASRSRAVHTREHGDGATVRHRASGALGRSVSSRRTSAHHRRRSRRVHRVAQRCACVSDRRCRRRPAADLVLAGGRHRRKRLDASALPVSRPVTGRQAARRVQTGRGRRHLDHRKRAGINTKFTFNPGSDTMPVWSQDGKQIAFVSNRNKGVFNIYVKASNGIGEDQVLLDSPNNKPVWDWSANGRFICTRRRIQRTETSGRCHSLETESRCGCPRRQPTSTLRRIHQTGDGSRMHRRRAGRTRCMCKDFRSRAAVADSTGSKDFPSLEPGRQGTVLELRAR